MSAITPKALASVLSSQDVSVVDIIATPINASEEILQAIEFAKMNDQRVYFKFNFAEGGLTTSSYISFHIKSLYNWNDSMYKIARNAIATYQAAMMTLRGQTRVTCLMSEARERHKYLNEFLTKGGIFDIKSTSSWFCCCCNEPNELKVEIRRPNLLRELETSPLFTADGEQVRLYADDNLIARFIAEKGIGMKRKGF